MDLAICAIFRNEAPYLREWIEFHRLVGVERIHLYQNRSEDDYESVLRSYIDEGFVELTDWPRQPPCQMEAYHDFISRAKGTPQWVAFLDCDEFLFSPCWGKVGEALEAIAAPEWGAVGVNWMCFGASGQDEPAPGLVIERFTRRPADSFGANRHIKSIVRMDRVEEVGPNPHQFHATGGTYSETGRRIVGPHSELPSHSLLRIHHYHTKSRQEYMRRIERGNADGAPRRSPAEFDLYQAAEIEDRSAWRFLPALRQRIEAQSAPKPVALPAPSDKSSCSTPQLMEARPEQRNFLSYRDCHRGETMLVCGCGSSLSRVISPDRFPTIGVNDVGRLFHPNYLVVVNPRNQFSGDRFTFVENSQAEAIFTQLDLGIPHPNLVRFNLGRRGGTDVSDCRSLPYTRNSPYVALCLALYMGAKRIGLIGVDFTDHHFFAQTGRHSLAREINQINNEYSALAETCQRMRVEVFNLSEESRLTAFPKITPEQFARSSLISADMVEQARGAKIFFVNYRFLSCGEVFSDGLRNAAEDLAVQSESAYWDDPSLPSRVKAFSPDLLFVVHGRKYSQLWKAGPHHRPAAVWLLDEPYEVDDTSRFAQDFDTILVNDPSTLHRHKNAYYLPVCYDPAGYFYQPGPREHRVGFIGGANPAREQMLLKLAQRSLLSYAIGGPWHSPEIRRVSPSANIPSTETAQLYRKTQIVVNVFRTVHHFNHDRIAAFSMNPRIYEALACGALVVSERRAEIEKLCPEMPVFDTEAEMASLIENLLGDPVRFELIRRACIRRLAGHTYTHRLSAAIAAATQRPALQPVVTSTVVAPSIPMMPKVAAPEPARMQRELPGWEPDPACVETERDLLVLHAKGASAPGSETGLIGTESYTDVRFRFELEMQPGATVIAKIHQVEQRNQRSNSYHLMFTGGTGYLARHDHVFHSFTLPLRTWHAIILTWKCGILRVQVNGKIECSVRDAVLESGFCFVGIKSGSARIRGLEITEGDSEEVLPEPEPVPLSAPSHDLLFDHGLDSEPVVSIVTTVYDRVSCLSACVRSVQALTFDRWEHIIVADAPSAPVLAQIRSLVEQNSNGRNRLRLAVLRARANDWGMTPATVGCSLSKGKYVCFLSDDNGYKPEHMEKLVAALDADPGLGFAYSGCLYDGRAILNAVPPAFGRIDLGQPLFRRELFNRYFGVRMPFRCLAWDWKMIETFLRHGVRWKHTGETTFLFRLAKYPQFAPTVPRQEAASKCARFSHTEPACVAKSEMREPALLPLSTSPRRNLMYHVWPVKGSMWRWNIAQLRQRLELFNGQRLISIVYDQRSDDPEAVQASLDGCGCEFIVSRNHSLGEAATFPVMLRRVASTDVNEVTFYAHAKGVKHEPNVPTPIRKWVDFSYRANLDNWSAVHAQLERFALTGSFRRFGRFEAHRNQSVWHYHGTFFWMRHARVFEKDCFRVPPFYCGVEAWPGVHFSREESGCLLFDDLQQPATDEEFWERAEPEIVQWEAAQRCSELR